MSPASRALITGITGQDGSYLAEQLLAQGYEVHGLIRRSSQVHPARISHLMHHAERYGRVCTLHYGDLADLTSLTHLVELVQPDVIYNLASQSHVRISFDMPEYTFDITGVGAYRMLEATRRSCPGTRFYQAGSSEMFGKTNISPQTEDTPFHPRSPYAIAKTFAHHTAIHYREAYNMFICNGILFNHESPRRGENFVTRKIARSAARIAAGLDTKLAIGNLAAQRDWGYAPEYVHAMQRMLEQDVPRDFVIATGTTHSVHEFLETAFSIVGLDYRDYIVHDEGLERRTEVDVLCGNSALAQRVLGWNASVRFPALVALMVEAEVEALTKEAKEI